jgi:hypothetical protein
MKPCRNYLLLAAGLLGLALALPCRSAAAPGQTFHFRFTGLTGSAFFDSLDVTGCVETVADVEAVNGRVKMVGGGPEATSSAFVSIAQFDNCNLTVLLEAFGSADLPIGAFQIDKKLASATLNTSIDVFDFVSGTTFPADVSMNWTGTGEAPSVSRDHTMFRAPGFRVNSTFTGTSHLATASGSVTTGGTNFSPSPAVFADLENVKQGELDVLH